METEITSRPLVYQLLLVQILYDRRGHGEGIAGMLNSHPLLVDSPHTNSDSEALEFYEALRNYHHIESSDEIEPRTKVPRPIIQLADVLYRAYSKSVLQDMEADQTEFGRLYAELDTHLR